MDDLLQEFIVESTENLESLDQDIVNLENDPNNKELISNIFRAMHTIKGTCGFIGLPRLEKLAHSAENVLGLIRDGELTATQDIVTTILDAIDGIKAILDHIAENGVEPEGDDKVIIKLLDGLAKGDITSREKIEDNNGEDNSSNVIENNEDNDNKKEEPQKEINEIPEETPTQDENPKEEKEAKSQEEEIKADEKEKKAKAKEQPKPQQTKKATKSEQTTEHQNKVTQSIRVNVDVLESLMNMVSELVLTRNQLMQTTQLIKDADELNMPMQRLNFITSELQEGVMKTRMQPVGSSWNKVPRLIRDASKDLGKKIDLEMYGEDTELDRQVLEMIGDPLTHMIRNSVDHGIEPPEERLEAGKSEHGKIILKAFHEGGHIIIQIIDDGKGIDKDVIKAKAIEKGLATEEELKDASDRQILQYIFAPGFSTAQKITNISGRGVGMDVVKTNIEKIGGSIDIDSTVGKGTTFTMQIPLTLAIVSGIIVEASGDKFAIPQINVVELVMAGANTGNKIDFVEGKPILRLRNELLPIAHLSDILGNKKDNPNQSDHQTGKTTVANDNDNYKTPEKNNQETKAVKEIVEGEDNHSRKEGGEACKENFDHNQNTLNNENEYDKELTIIVLKIGMHMLGVIVDSVSETQEIVVKPVSPLLSHIPMFSGNTILGDGSVVMILDAKGLSSKLINSNSKSSEESREEKAKSTKEHKKTSYLLFENDNNKQAVPLSQVTRIEEIDLSNIETANHKSVIQYRGNLMPIFTVDGSEQQKEDKKKPVLVFGANEHSVGVVVDHIVDIVDEYVELKVKANSGSTNIYGSTILRDQTTDIINVDYYLQSAFPNWFDGSKAINASNSQYDKSVLIINDNEFFTNLMLPIFNLEGYDSHFVDEAEDAREILIEERERYYDVVIIDIDNNIEDKINFVEQLKDIHKYSDVAVFAISSKITNELEEKIANSSFNGLINKHNKNDITDAINFAIEEKIKNNTNEGVVA